MTKEHDIVCVDDESIVTDLFLLTAQRLIPHRTFAAVNNAEEVYQMVLKHEIRAKCWLLDIMMPGKNGGELAEAIARRDPHAQIFAYTGLAPIAIRADSRYAAYTKYFRQFINKTESIPDTILLLDLFISQA